MYGRFLDMRDFASAMTIDHSHGPSSLNTPLPSTHHLKPCPNPDLWEYNSEELVRFVPMRKLSGSTRAFKERRLSSLFQKRKDNSNSQEIAAGAVFYIPNIPPLTKNVQDKTMKLLPHAPSSC